MGPVHLTDRGGGSGFGIEVRELIRDSVAELVLDHPLHVLERNRRSRIPQLCELGLQFVPIIRREPAPVDQRCHLPDLHRGALHLTEHGDDVFGNLPAAAHVGCPSPLLGARQVRRPGRVPASRLATQQAPDLSTAAEPPHGDCIGEL